MNDRIDGFVLSINDYKEADVLMQVLTKDYGILSLVGKASKKMDGKNHFLPMCIYEFIIDYKQGKSIYSIHGHKLLNNFFDDTNIDLIALKNVLIEATMKNRDMDLYDQLKFCFENIDNTNKYLIGSMYFASLIKKFGVTPIVDGCAVCGNSKVVGVSNIQGGFLCEKHLNGENTYPVDMLKKFRLIIKGDIVHYDILKDFTYTINDFYLVVNFFLENADLKLKSYDFYKSLN